MAIMIPDMVSPDIKSNAEKNIFNWFKNADGTENWIILHSLGIAQHCRVVHGEIDFLVLAPGLGIFALEVKGGRVTRKMGKWIFTDKYDNNTKKVRGPFDQAWEGIYSIKELIDINVCAKNSHLKHLVFGIGVMFPDTEYDFVGAEEAPWQVFDIKDGKNVRGFIERIAKGSRETIERVGFSDARCILPTDEDVRWLAELFRGDFDFEVPLKIKQKYADEEMLSLTKEQSICLDQLNENKRVLIHGTAGTGKTLLAIELAKRAAAKGESVAVICFNRNLADWLKTQFEEYPLMFRPMFIGTIHSFMSRLTSMATGHMPTRGDRSANDFYNNVLPEMTEAALRLNPVYYDKIIIDEAQDVISGEYLRILDLCLKGGISGGKWAAFGDFARQAIYSNMQSELEYFELLESKTAFTIFKLTRNCRNTKKICMEMENILGVPEIAAFNDSLDTPPVNHITYSDSNNQKDKLTEVIENLLDDNVKRSEIIILSPCKRADSVVNLLDGITIKDYTVNSDGNIRFCTIQGFKGLESQIVILTDIKSYSDEKLLYVALSRARFGLYILETDEAAQERSKLFFQRRLENGA